MPASWRKGSGHLKIRIAVPPQLHQPVKGQAPDGDRKIDAIRPVVDHRIMHCIRRGDLKIARAIAAGLVGKAAAQNEGIFHAAMGAKRTLNGWSPPMVPLKPCGGYIVG